MTDCLCIHHKLNTCGFKEARGGYSQKRDCERSTAMGELFAVGHCRGEVDRQIITGFYAKPACHTSIAETVVSWFGVKSSDYLPINLASAVAYCE